MSDFERTLRRELRSSSSAREAKTEILAAESGEAVETGKRWPALRSLLTVYAIPRLKQWLKELQAVINPEELKSLARHKRRLELLGSVTWWHPRGLYIRARVIAYGAAILVLGVFWLSLVIGAVLLVFFLLSKLVGFLQRMLMLLN